MRNRLKGESSPYLLQHADHPVDWYPWCEEAFERAKREEKPVFLSIGYSTCHWCHVMARESFSNPEIAEILNRFFISIKVDREERPDIDAVYMAFCQAFTGRGGWPMSIFLTPEQKPFFAGTYFPPTSQFGALGFRELLTAVAEKWETNRLALLQSAEQIVAALNAKEPAGQMKIEEELPHQALLWFEQNFDSECGGFGSAPKFPTPHNLLFLTLYSVLKNKPQVQTMANVTLTKMRQGGIFDQIGFGFSRYSTDRLYLVPHFEKMLYDNALLILAYAAAYQATGVSLFLDTAEKTADFVARELTAETGGFYSALDADSDGEEGKFYLWSPKEVEQVLGEVRAKEFCACYDITEKGNFEGKSIPNLLHTGTLPNGFQEERQALYAYRKTRGALHLDDKILTAWNALMIGALAVLYRVSGKETYLQTAKNACRFLEETLTEGNTVYVSWRNGTHSEKGFLDEYAYLIFAYLALYEATDDEQNLNRAEELCKETKRQFADAKHGGYFFIGRENASLIRKPKETYDGALPSGNSMMAYNLVRLFAITEKEEYKKAADYQLAYASKEAEPFPAGCCVFLIALLLHQHSEKITVVLAEGETKVQIRKQLPLSAVVDVLQEETETYKRLNGKTTYYVCRDQICEPPTNVYHRA
ncbi:MAG: thioredoxin domain-containing protein [Lachnospiraceae bacterium]